MKDIKVRTTKSTNSIKNIKVRTSIKAGTVAIRYPGVYISELGR